MGVRDRISSDVWPSKITLTEYLTQETTPDPEGATSDEAIRGFLSACFDRLP